MVIRTIVILLVITISFYNCLSNYNSNYLCCVVCCTAIVLLIDCYMTAAKLQNFTAPAVIKLVASWQLLI